MMAPKENVADSSSCTTTTTWDQTLDDLERQGGMAVVRLPPESAKIHALAFLKAREAMDDVPFYAGCPIIPPGADSAHVTGYHTTEGMSRYNSYREGMVFSDGNFCGNDEFQFAMSSMFDSLHGIAQQVLTALERQWQLPNDWFQNTLGPTENYSQWHIKRYVLPHTNNQSDDTATMWLPVHTDPSLISIVVHDRPGMQEGAMGLEYQTESGKWVQMPSSGHRSATVFVGSVLSFITGGRIRAAKHRVVYSSDDNDRMAATLFVRPRGTAQLQVPPSLQFQDVSLKRQIDFDAWSSRVSRNYMKKKKHNNSL